jgi:hypothetical protein
MITARGNIKYTITKTEKTCNVFSLINLIIFIIKPNHPFQLFGCINRSSQELQP